MDTVAVDVGTATVNLVKQSGHSLHVEKLPTADPVTSLSHWLDLFEPTPHFAFRYSSTIAQFVTSASRNRVFEIAEHRGALRPSIANTNGGIGPGFAALQLLAARHRVKKIVGLDVGAETTKTRWYQPRLHEFDFSETARPCKEYGVLHQVDGMIAALEEVHRPTWKGGELTVVCSGGDGPLYAAALAERMGLVHAIVPDYAGCFEAVGLILHGEVFQVEKTLRDIPLSVKVLRDAFCSLMEDITRRISIAGLDFDDVTCAQWVALSRKGDERERFVVCTSAMDEHDIARSYSGSGDQAPIQPQDLVMRRAFAQAELDISGVELPPPPLATTRRTTAMPDYEVRRYLISGRIIERCELVPGARVDGPAAIREPWHVTVVPAGWRAEVAMAGGILLRRVGA